MFIRALFLLLIALNLGVAAWLVFAPQAAPEPPPIADPGVNPLVLLSERSVAAETESAELTGPPESSAELGLDRCLTLGTFPSQADMREALVLVTPLVKRARLREAMIEQPRGFWVFLEALSTREAALDLARRLSAQGVRDYYVVTAGDQQNTISLGLFRDIENAERRRREVAAMGFDALVEQRTEQLPSYWLDYAESPNRPLLWRERLARWPDLKENAIECF